MSSPRRLVRNLVSSASVTAASAASVIAIQAIVSKAYGSRMFGVYTLVLAIARIMLAAADLGVDTFVYREVAQRPERTREWVDTALHLRVRLAVPGIAVGILLFALLGPSSQLATAIVLLADQTLGDASVLLFHVFVAQRDAHLQALLAVPALAARVVGALLVVRAGGDLVVLAGVLLACHVAQLACTFLVARARGWVGGRRALHVRQLVRDAWPIGLSNVIKTLYFKLDSLLLAAMLTTRAVGLYNAAYLLATGTTLASVVVRSIGFPELSSAFLEKQPFRRVRASFLLSMGALAVGATIGIWIAGPWVIDHFFGADFAASKAVIPIFAVAAAAIFANEASQAVLLSSHQQQLDLRCGIAALGLNVVLNVALIPTIGFAGAAWATLATEVAGAFLRFWYGRAAIRAHLQAM